MPWRHAYYRSTDKAMRSLVLTPAGMAATEDYKPWPRMVPKCWRCDRVLAECSCYDECWARWAA